MIPILQLDIAGNPSSWLNHRDAISMAACGRVVASLGDEEFIFHGGMNRLSGLRSEVTIGPILLTKERVLSDRLSADYAPPLTNKGLFSRDAHRCLYCGGSFSPSYLTRDHITPKSRGGGDFWTNSATACKSCNNKKGSQTPEEWGHLLLAVPFMPNRAEYLYLKNTKRIIASQQDFLKLRFPKGSRLL